MQIRLELLPESGRMALVAFCHGDRSKATIRGIRRHKLVAWERGAWRLTRGGWHAAQHYSLEFPDDPV